MQIIGAGLAGLLSANVFPKAGIMEAQNRDKIEHKALLRFRSNAVAEATGVEFRKVIVHKGIWHDDKFVEPSIKLSNLYSQKVIGMLADRSIWNLQPATRYIAPDDFLSQLIDNCGNRIEWNCTFDIGMLSGPAISTMPMSVLSAMLQVSDVPAFKYAPIVVYRAVVHNSDVFQTVYFTNAETPIYRASITGSTLIIEAMSAISDTDIATVMRAFGICQYDEVGQQKQKFGKIAAIDDEWRKSFILRASTKHNIYSVGRFATWKNILLDDVVHDLAVVKRLIKNGSIYEKLKGV
jgi:hypothetical protein